MHNNNNNNRMFIRFLSFILSDYLTRTFLLTVPPDCICYAVRPMLFYFNLASLRLSTAHDNNKPHVKKISRNELFFTA